MTSQGLTDHLYARKFGKNIFIYCKETFYYVLKCIMEKKISNM